MLLHESLQRGMISHELIVIYQRGIPPNLFGDLAVSVQELIKLRKLLPGDVTILNGGPAILSWRGVHNRGDAERD